jgi:hypothetical protein
MHDHVRGDVMKMVQGVPGLLMTVLSGIGLYLFGILQIIPPNNGVPTALFGYLLVIFLPGLIIDLVFRWVSRGFNEDITEKCGGLSSGGYLIGVMERSLIFLAILIAYYDNSLSYAAILSFLSVIVAGKAIFRYSSKDTGDRACADWYIFGTFMSITMALALTWWIFRFLLTG